MLNRHWSRPDLTENMTKAHEKHAAFDRAQTYELILSNYGVP